MFETPMTIVGRIITDPRRRVVAGQEVISFRVASNSRRRTGEGTWEPGHSLYVTVNCWGRLVTGVGAGLYKGAAVIAVGTVHTSEYEDREGLKRSSLEMRASAVGPDLARVIARIEQQPKPGETTGDAAGGTAGDAAGDTAHDPGDRAGGGDGGADGGGDGGANEDDGAGLVLAAP